MFAVLVWGVCDIFLEISYKANSNYAYGEITKLWWTEGDESDTYYVSYKFTTEEKTPFVGKHSIDLSRWNRLDNETENYILVQYLEAGPKTNRLVGENYTFWGLFKIVLSSLLLWCFLFESAPINLKALFDEHSEFLNSKYTGRRRWSVFSGNKSQKKRSSRILDGN